MRPLLLTPGEPAGIGPDITLSLLDRTRADDVIVVADPDLLRDRAEKLGLKLKIRTGKDLSTCLDGYSTDCMNVLSVDGLNSHGAGTLDAGNSGYVLSCLDIAAQHCRDGSARAMVTAPVHKGIINDAGFTFTGHTEYLAAPTNSQPVMMLATPELRVVLATTHLPLRDVADAIDTEMLIEKIRITHGYLRSNAGIDTPRLMVLGLNPHAGEDGHLGDEEIDIITPALDACREQGIDAIGPIPADTAFTQRALDGIDAVIAMYHDQGLPVLKHSGFGRAINLTMGLPFIRTSVDHGTALELAGTGRADDRSLEIALDVAREFTS